MKLLAGKRVLILGIASKHSIAYGIADKMFQEGAELVLTYQNERLKDRVLTFAEGWGKAQAFPLDVQNDAQIDDLFSEIRSIWPEGIDTIIHSIGFAPAEELAGNYADVTTRAGFQAAHDISSYSFTAVAKAGKDLLAMRGGNLLTLTYQASQKVAPNYNVMGLAKASLEASVRYLATALGPKGIRVNAISAGPIKTLAASGIKNFRKLLAHNEKITPLRKNVTTEEVANAAVFLSSDLASAITGEILHVDAGLSTQACYPADIE